MIGGLLVAAAALTATPVEHCSVMAVVAREHLHFDQRASPPLRASGDYLPECPWEDLGVKIGTTPAYRQSKLVFRPPTIDGDTAKVIVLVIYAPLAGARWDCRLRKVNEQWKLGKCWRITAI